MSTTDESKRAEIAHLTEGRDSLAARARLARALRDVKTAEYFEMLCGYVQYKIDALDRVKP